MAEKRFFFTREMEEWINENSSMYSVGQRQLMVDDFNSRFGSDINKCQMTGKIHRQFSPNVRYTKEQDDWIKDHWYLNRKDMTRMFNSNFRQNRTFLAIKNRCLYLGAIKCENKTIVSLDDRTITPEMDIWIIGNADRFRRDHSSMLKEMNSLFGTRVPITVLKTRIKAIGAQRCRYSKEEDDWLVAHRDTERVAIVSMFKEEFGSDRSFSSISTRMVRLGAWNRNCTKNIGRMAQNGQ